MARLGLLHGYILATLLMAALCLSPGAKPSSASGGAEARCEVCQDFLERFYGSLKKNHSDFSMASIEEELIKTCMEAKGKEHRLCYYLGATENAAAKILTEVSRPMSGHVPAAKICEKLKKVDLQICELKHERQLDLTSVDLSKMRVAELKKILESWGEVCRACAEKTDFVSLIKEVAPKHIAAPAKADL